jgi:signal recognition particle subunit SRP19
LAKRDHSGYILWPEYFDSNLSRSHGRRVPIDLAVNSPNCEEIFLICKKLGLSPELEKRSAHPSRWFDPKGRVKVPEKSSKSETIEKVAKALSKRR